MSATGKAQTRSRQVVTYGSRQAAVNAQASATGPSVGFVIGSSTYWKWEPGITRDVEADDYDGTYSVTINDTNVDPGSRSGNGSGSGDDSNSDDTGSNSGDEGCEHTPSHAKAGMPCGAHSDYSCQQTTHQLLSCPTDRGRKCEYQTYYACSPHTHAYAGEALRPCGHPVSAISPS